MWPGLAAFPDFTDPKARAWWGEKLKGFLEMGVAGFWLDMNEPALFAAWGSPPCPQAPATPRGPRGDHRLAHNLYGLLMARASWEGFRKHAPERRPFLLTRSGHAGVQRYAWTWTGDVESTWEGLRTTLRALLGLSLSGVYFVGSDIGGFSGNPSPELYLRWFQMAALTPFFRLHAARWTKRREPWRFGEEVLEGVRRAMALRESLLPYLYTLAHRASREGKPLLRPLFLEGGPTRRRPSSWGRPSWWPPSWRRGRGPRRCPCPRAAGTPGGRTGPSRAPPGRGFPPPGPDPPPGAGRDRPSPPGGGRPGPPPLPGGGGGGGPPLLGRGGGGRPL